MDDGAQVVGVDQGQQRVDGAKSVPEAVVCNAETPEAAIQAGRSVSTHTQYWHDKQRPSAEQRQYHTCDQRAGVSAAARVVGGVVQHVSCVGTTR